MTNSSGTDSNVGAAASSLAGYQYDYVEKTSNTSITATSAATANTVVTGAAIAYDGSTAVWIDFSAYSTTKGTNAIYVLVFDGSSSIGIIGAGPGTNTFYGRMKVTPSAATHTYSIRAYVDAGTGAVSASNAGADNYVPCCMTITKV